MVVVPYAGNLNAATPTDVVKLTTAPNATNGIIGPFTAYPASGTDSIEDCLATARIDYYWTTYANYYGGLT